MVRSNFDYTNRASSGERLGASIASDFLKKATQTAKPAKAATRPSKKNTDAALTAKQSAHTKLDIRIPNKALTDAGLLPVADALVQALIARSDLVLTDLNLSGNDITTKSLRALAQVVRHAPEIVALDLSNNKIAVVNKDASNAWEEFAEACLSRHKLVKLDLSENQGLGALALEALARITHTVTNESVLRRDFDLSRQDDGRNNFTAPGAEMLKPDMDVHESLSNGDVSYSSGASPASLKSIQSQRPRTIAVRNTGLDERCALFASALMDHEKTKNPFKIQWDNNIVTLGKDASHLMALAQKLHNAKDSLQPNDTVQAAADSEWEEDTVADAQSDGAIEANGAEGHDLDEEAIRADVDRAIKKVQRNVIIEHGYRSVELWSAGMEVFAISRKIYALTTGIQWQSPLMVQPRISPPPGLPSPDPKKRALNQSGVWAINQHTPGTPKSKQKMVVAGAGIGLPLLRGTRNPPVLRVPENDSLRDMEPSSKSNGHTPGVSRLPVRTCTPHNSRQKCVDWQEQHLRSLQSAHGGASKGYRDTSLSCQLPLTVCKRILYFSAHDRSLSLLSERQQAKAFEWGQLHDSLKTEHDWRNRDKASQVWMLLEALECLEYE